MSQGADGPKVDNGTPISREDWNSYCLMRHLCHWSCFTEGVITSSSGQPKRMHDHRAHTISANATLEPVTTERLGSGGGSKAYSASELLKVAVSGSCPFGWVSQASE